MSYHLATTDFFSLSTNNPQAADALGEALRENKSLTSLNLSFAELGPKGVAPLAAGLAQHPALTQLNLSRNAITSHGIKEIGTAHNLRLS
jgi:Ran GTPase-activating protein (RanGAP) involved in mRNA processing and transport